MIRLLVPAGSLASGKRAVDGEDHHYLFRVRRLRAGDELLLLDGEGREASCRVVSVDPRAAELEVGEVRAAEGAGPARLTVALAILKGERTDWCLPKLVELGVGRIVPLLTERSVVRLEGERARRRRERYRAQVRAAAQQSRSALVPVVEPVMGLPEALSSALTGAELKLMLWEEARAIPLRSALPERPPSSAAILIGPEGGFSDQEVEQARAAGFAPVGLGQRILRAETAAVAAAAILAYAFGDI
jgi:16S rRNA (uracil1498-N3)-methyltransferase